MGLIEFTAFPTGVYFSMLGLFKPSWITGKRNDKSADEAADETASPGASAGGPGWFDRLKGGLKATGSRIGGLFNARRIDETLFEELEDALLMADAGVEASAELIARLRERARAGRLENAAQLKAELKSLLIGLLEPLEAAIDLRAARPFVIMLAGVNGTGKTTSIGKIAHYLKSQGLTVLLAAGDTFRAAAREQLAAWGERNGVAVISQQGGDPAAVIFDSVQAARSRGTDVVLADTAGRLPTQLHLMDELKKIKRVMAKADAAAPHAVWLVLDANTGQNGLAQFQAFDRALGLTGLILTKLDGSAKGGILAAIARLQGEGPQSRRVPIVFVGVGEGLDDLRPFDAREFVSALLD
jgi:fused signal recognition particle receptor